MTVVVNENEASISVDWANKLLTTQKKFFFSPSTRKLYIGPVGSGKSEVLTRVFASLMFRRPGNRGLIGRLTYKDFEGSTLIALKRVIPPHLILEENTSKGILKMKSVDENKPSIIQYAHFDKWEQYGSVEVGVIALDEITEIPFSVYEFLETRMRLMDCKKYYMLGVGNPNGHDAYWKAFHPDSSEKKPGYEWFSPEPFENDEHLPKNYYQDLITRHGSDWVKRFVYGSCDVFEGQIYPMLNEKIHRKKNAVIPHPPPRSWPRLIMLDHGYRNPTAVLFAAIDPDGVVWIYDEHYQRERLVAHHSNVIKRKYLEHCAGAVSVRWVADPSIFIKNMQRPKEGKIFSIYDEYCDHGLSDWEHGENDRQAGYNRVAEYLQATMLFFLDRCPNAWDEMIRLHWRRPLGSSSDQKFVEEEADVDNHCPAAIRYGLMTRPEAAFVPKKRVELTRGEHQRVRTRRIYRQSVLRLMHEQSQQFNPKSDQGDFVS